MFKVHPLSSRARLAEKFDMTLTGIKKHVGVLERAGLVTTEKVGRVRTCKLGPRRLVEETAWIERYHQLWASRFDRRPTSTKSAERGWRPWLGGRPTSASMSSNGEDSDGPCLTYAG